MKSGTVFWGGAIAVGAVLAAASFHELSRRPPSSESQWVAPLATPPGITLQLRTVDVKTRPAPPAEMVFADQKGMSLYSHAANAGDATCAGECLTQMLPALAPTGAMPIGDWSLNARADGTRQWVYRGAPLFRFEGDAAIGDAHGERAAWHAVALRPAAGMVLRAGIDVREIDDAGGTALVDSSGLTVYAFNREAAHEAQCAESGECMAHWRPLQAPGIAVAAGDFALISRDDGIAQWAYRGKPLYTFDGDTKPLDVNGIDIDPRFQVALFRRFFMPADATIRRIIPLGAILTTARGATLYQRDRALTSEEGHDFREDHGPPALGRSFGTATCDANCATTWRPYAAPPDAVPSGFWDIAARPDGTRQWVYKGFALYTYAADKPGEINGNEIYDLAQVRDTAKAGGGDGGGDTAGAASVEEKLGRGIPPKIGTGVGALFWHAVVP
jgi:predicted lipoprotein with Yx(FWY)xxD motif